mgnify:CR=1 FL=1
MTLYNLGVFICNRNSLQSYPWHDRCILANITKIGFLWEPLQDYLFTVLLWPISTLLYFQRKNLRQNLKCEVGTCILLFSFDDFCNLSQNWPLLHIVFLSAYLFLRFFAKLTISAKIASPSYDLLCYFQHLRLQRKIAIFATACKPGNERIKTFINLYFN